LCADPAGLLAELFAFCGFAAELEPLLEALPAIKAPRHDALAAESQVADAIWQATCSTAECFGYTRNAVVPAARHGAQGPRRRTD
jgi:hypothetical protein